MGRRKSRRAWLIVIVAAWAIYDYAVPPRKAVDARVAVAAIESYQAHVSPLLRGRVECRFKPTCSHYGHDAIAKYGLMKGGAKAAWRIARCGPWTKAGTVDRP